MWLHSGDWNVLGSEGGNAGIHTLLNYLFGADVHSTKARYQETESTCVDENEHRNKTIST